MLFTNYDFSEVKKELIDNQLRYQKVKLYRFPKGFTSFDDFVQTNVKCAFIRDRILDGIQQNKITVEEANKFAPFLVYGDCFNVSSPIYAVSNEIIKALDNTKFDMLLNFKPAINSAFLLLPKKVMYDSHNEYVITIAFVFNNNYLSIAAFGNNGSSWNRSRLVKIDGTLIKPIQVSKCDELFGIKLTNFCVSVLALLTFQPNLLGDMTPEETEVSKHQNKGFRKKETINYIYPRWLGKNYKTKTSRSQSTDNSGTHTSPRTHWRSGHWRDQPVGTGRQEIKKIWIEPVLINPPN